MTMRKLLLIVGLVAAVTAASADTLNANPPPANNGGSTGWAMFLDLTATSGNLLVTDLVTASTAAANATYSIEVFTRSGSGLGGPVGSGPGSSPVGWTSLGTAIATQGGAGVDRRLAPGRHSRHPAHAGPNDRRGPPVHRGRSALFRHGLAAAPDLLGREPDAGDWRWSQRTVHDDRLVLLVPRSGRISHLYPGAKFRGAARTGWLGPRASAPVRSGLRIEHSIGRLSPP